MSQINATAAGSFTIGGDLVVNRLGFGAMRITGAGIWGEPADREEAKRTLRRLPDLGVNFIDTADSYGPFVSEDLIRETLAPYTGLVIATKGGQVRHGPNIWRALGRPDYLRQCVLMSLRRLGSSASTSGSSTRSTRRCRARTSTGRSPSCRRKG